MLMDLVPLVVPVAALLSLAFVIVGVTRVVVEGRTRRRLIEAGANPEVAAAIVAPVRSDPGLHGALKWGLVTGAVGLALVVIQFIPYGPDDPIVFGLVLVFGAAGLLAYYASARRIASRQA